jgi:hypothetical protein
MGVYELENCANVYLRKYITVTDPEARVRFPALPEKKK